MNKLSVFFLVLLWGISLGCPAQSQMESNLSYRRFTTLDGLSQMQAETVWQDSRGYIYIGTLSGFARYDGRQLTPFLRGQRENIVGFQEVANLKSGRTEVRAMGFVRQWNIDGEKAKKQEIDPQKKLLLNNFNAADLPNGYVLLEDRQEQNRKVCQLTPKGRKQVIMSPLLDKMTPDRKLYLDSIGLYVPTPAGLYRIQKGRVALKLSAKDDVFSLIRNRERLYAFASDGIYAVGADSLTLLSKHRFEAPDYGLIVRSNQQGKLFVADSHTIWSFDGNWHQLATGFNLIKSLYVDKWNRLWAATYQGVYCFFHCNFVNHRLNDRNDIVRAIGTDRDGRLVMGTLNGKVLVNRQLVNETSGNYFAPSAVTIGDRVYMAGNGDVVAVMGDTMQWLGLPDDKYQFVSRYADRLIVGTRGSILSFNPATRQTDTLTTDIVRPWCAADDGQGRLWVSGNPGLFCLTGSLDKGEVKVRKVKSTPTTLVITAMASDGRGRTCFALGDSLFVIQGEKISAAAEALPTLKGHEIRSLHISRRGHLIVAAIDGLMVARLDNGSHISDIHWFDAQNGFTMIEPLAGQMAESADGTVWLGGLEEMVSFDPELLLLDNQEPTVVEEPQSWWMQLWVWLVAVLFLSAFIWVITRWFEQKRARRKMEHLRREKKQKELLLSTVRLKAIPHFHSNVLASIEYFVSTHSTEEATHYLKLYSDFTNQTMSDIDRPSRSVAEEIDYVRAYMELESLRYGNRLHYSIDVAPDVDQSTMLPTMLLHTYCQNAVKHGIANKDGGGNVTVAVRSQRQGGADGVLVAVTDDGVGRTDAAHSGSPSTKQGLKILRQQIELYNIANRNKIVQRVIDLTDAQGRPAGTRFETWVPAEYKF